MEESKQIILNKPEQKLVLVTGASGYLACHVINILLENGFKVRATVRSLQNQKKLDPIKNINPAKAKDIEFVEADLLDDTCWDKVVAGCYYVCHVASPFPETIPKDEQVLIKPAVQGATNVLNAAVKNGVKKVVMTSSIASVYQGHPNQTHFSEKDWTVIERAYPYEKSKTLAEKKAWEIFEQSKGKLKLTIINPGAILGPSFHSNTFTSGQIVVRILSNQMPGIPKMSFALVDVRDVAQAHVNALLREDETNGKRYILNGTTIWCSDVVNILKQEFGPLGYKTPCLNVGKTIFTIASWFDAQARQLSDWVDRFITFDNYASQKELGICYRHIVTTLIDTGYDLIEKGLIKKTKKHQQQQQLKLQQQQQNGSANQQQVLHDNVINKQ